MGLKTMKETITMITSAFKTLCIYLLKILYSPLWLAALIVLLLAKGYNMARQENDYLVDECLKSWKYYWMLDNDEEV